MTALRRLSLLLAVLAFAWWAGLSLAAEGVPAPAQEAFERGLAAAEQQQWGLAVRYFGEAQKAAETTPGILFNLGLAHGKASQELPAIAWLQAYLARTGQPANADAVRKEILRLEIAAEAKIARVMQQALAANAAAAAAAGKDSPKAYVQATIGEVDAAIRSGVSPDDAWYRYANFLAYTWQVEKAEAALGRISDVTKRDAVYDGMTQMLIHRSFTAYAPFPLSLSFPRSATDVALSRAAVMKIQNPENCANRLIEILENDFHPGDVPLAETLLARLRQLPASPRRDSYIEGLSKGITEHGASLFREDASPYSLMYAWMDAARTLSRDDVAMDLSKVLASVGTLKAADAGNRLNEVVIALAGRLFALRGAALRAAQR